MMLFHSRRLLGADKTDNKEKDIMADLQHKLNDVAQKRERQI
ncbi:TPA: hypothetical protein ACGRG7_001548 [Morganella morganii]